MASAALLAAQNRLMARRNALTSNRSSVTRPTTAPPLPAHLGWGSARLTKAQHRPTPTNNPVQTIIVVQPTIPAAPPEPEAPTTTTLFPDLAVAVLQRNQVAAARIWWMLRLLDHTGSGHFSAENARAALTYKTSATRVCGWRQLRKLLKTGDGTFWRWDGKTVWLRSRIKVASTFDIKRFAMRGTTFSAETLMRPIAELKAALYATFHQGRAATPIARATLASVVGISESSQRRYEQMAKIEAEPQYALTSISDNQEAAWQFSHATFQLTDKLGKHGPKGAVYHARQIPNIFRPKTSPIDQTTKSTVRRLNRRLTDLLKLGTAGNGKHQRERRYFANGTRLKAGGGIYQSGQTSIWYTLHPTRLGRTTA